MQKKQHIRSVFYKLEDGDINAALASSIMLKEAKIAKEDGWEEITMRVHTLPDRFTVSVYGTKQAK